jgi:glucose-1-phosphate thymidylyltransferase
MYPLTEKTPKPLLPLMGKPMINHIIEQINTIKEADEIIVVSNSKFYSHFCEWAASKEASENTPPISVLDNGTTSNENRRGAVGDLFFAIQEKSINDEVFVIAGDTYFTYDIREQLAVFRETGCDTLCGKELDDPERLKSLGIALLAPNGKLLDFEEKPQKPKSNIVIYAAYFFRKQTVALVEKFLSEGNSPDNIGSFPQWLLKFQDIFTYRMNGDCHDIGTIKDYEKINNERW